jgi:hypothetical protein
MPLRPSRYPLFFSTLCLLPWNFFFPGSYLVGGRDQGLVYSFIYVLLFLYLLILWSNGSDCKCNTGVHRLTVGFNCNWVEDERRSCACS